jgi:hypothetical protein
VFGSLIGPILDALRWVWEHLRGPRLRLDLPFVPGEPEQHVLPIVQNNKWQVVFGLALRNEGRREARNWRVRFVTTSVATTIALVQQSGGRKVTQTLAGSGWQYEVHAAGPSDTVPPGTRVSILGRHTLNFASRLDVVLVKCWITAEGVPGREDTLCLEPDWTTMTAQFRRHR